jgi:hypothetical protein
MQRTLPAVLGAALLLLAACGGPATSTPAATSASGATSGPTAPPPATTSASAAPTAAPATAGPTIVPRPSGSLEWPTEFAVEMTPGTYFTSPPFIVAMTIAIEEAGWHAGHLNPVFIDLQRFDGVAVGSFPTRMLAFGWPENVRGNGGPVPVAGSTPAAAVDLMAERGSVQADERAAVELFGLEGERIDLHSDLGNNPIFGTANGDFGLGPELDVRLVVLPLDDGLLMVGILAAADDLDDAWEQAQTILETVDLQG